MSDGTKIQWTDATWNPTLGCKAVSPGCDNCYAARLASGRLAHIPAYAGLAKDSEFTGEVRLLHERLDQPLRWQRPRRIFVDSMSDLFHPDVPSEFIWHVFSVMYRCPQHQFQVLTKRPQRMERMLQTFRRPAHTPPNVWLGTSIESFPFAFRADHLRHTPAARRFISAEPLLGPLTNLNLWDIDWLIVGCESGPKARPMELWWARELRDMAADAGTKFFCKQIPDPEHSGRVLHDLDRFPADLRIREWPA